MGETENKAWTVEKNATAPQAAGREEAERIILHALVQYRTPVGYEGYLVSAASLLEALGPEAWRALEWLASKGYPECEYFVSPIATLKGVTGWVTHASSGSAPPVVRIQ